MSATTMVQTFGQWLKEKLELRGSANNKLARYINVSKGTVSRWINNDDTPSPPNCYRIAEYLDREPEEVLALAGHLKKSEEEVRRLGLLADFREAQRRSEETHRMMERIERELLGNAQSPEPPR